MKIQDRYGCTAHHPPGYFQLKQRSARHQYRYRIRRDRYHAGTVLATRSRIRKPDQTCTKFWQTESLTTISKNTSCYYLTSSTRGRRRRAKAPAPRLYNRGWMTAPAVSLKNPGRNKHASLCTEAIMNKRKANRLQPQPCTIYTDFTVISRRGHDPHHKHERR